MADKIHIGEMIKQKLKENGQKNKWLAEKINTTESNMSKILKKSYLNTELLRKISDEMDYDFFKYLTKNKHYI